MTLQRVAERAQALGNSFAIVETVHAQHQLASRKGGPQLAGSARHFLRCRTFFKRLEVDSDRETAGANRPPTGADTLEPGAAKNLCIGHHPSHTLQEVAEVAPRLETKQIKFE